MNGVAGRMSIWSKPAWAIVRRETVGREMGPMTRELEREPVLGERATLPRAPVRNNHRQPSAGPQRRADTAEIEPRFDHVLERVTKDHRVERLGLELRGRTGSDR